MVAPDICRRQGHAVIVVVDGLADQRVEARGGRHRCVLLRGRTPGFRCRRSDACTEQEGRGRGGFAKVIAARTHDVGDETRIRAASLEVKRQRHQAIFVGRRETGVGAQRRKLDAGTMPPVRTRNPVSASRERRSTTRRRSPGSASAPPSAPMQSQGEAVFDAVVMSRETARRDRDRDRDHDQPGALRRRTRPVARRPDRQKAQQTYARRNPRSSRMGRPIEGHL